MKNIISTVFFLLTLICTQGFSQNNLIDNGNFESTDAPWIVTNKSGIANPPVGSLITHKDNASGAYQIAIPVNEENEKLNLSNIQLKSGGFVNFTEALAEETVFQLSADVYGSQEGRLKYMIQWESGSNKIQSEEFTITTDNQTFTSQLAVPAGATKWIVLLQLGGTVGDVVVDNIVLEVAPEKTDEELVQEAIEDLKITFDNNDPKDGLGIMYDVSLPTVGLNNTTVTWESSHSDVISANGNVVRGDQTTEVTLTASVTLNTTTLDKDFTVSVLPYTDESGNAIIVNADLELGETVGWETSFNAGQVSESDFTYSSTVHAENASNAGKLEITNGGVSLPNLVIRTQWYPFNEATLEKKYFEVTSNVYTAIDETITLRYQVSGRDAESNYINSNSRNMDVTPTAADVTSVVETPAGLTSWRLLLQVGGNTGTFVFDNAVLKEVSANEGQAKLVAESLSLTFADGETATTIESDFEVVTTDALGYGTSLTWVSSNTDIITITDGSAVVTEIVEDTEVTLTAQISQGDYSINKEFNLTVLASDNAKLAAAKEDVAIEFAEGDAADQVSEDIVLLTTSLYETTVTWESTHTNITAEGVVTLGDETVTGKLTATISLGDLSTTKEFDLTTVRSNSSLLNEAVEAVEITYANEEDAQSVESDVTLPSTGLNETTISWVSDNEEVVTSAGVVTPQTTNQTVKLTATVALGELSDSKEFTLIVLNNASKVISDSKEHLQVGFADGEEASQVTSDLELITSDGDVTITWASSNTDVVTADGKVTQQLYDETVELTATLVLGDEQETKTFTVVVANNAEEVVNDALANVQITYANGEDNTSVISDITLSGDVNEVTVSWSSSDEEVITNAGAVTRAEEDKNVTMTATLSAGDATATKTFDLTVLMEEQIPTSVEDELLELVVFPNPSSDLITIRSEVQINTLEVFDMLGRQIELSKEGTEFLKKINISGLPKGNYILKVNQQSRVFIKQ
ncbi:immunoglobulin-like domain-containing protein [Flammeovirga sp. SubArs3]|uniref:T9SS type A sorting domain-containing protein n=1 Tax=Flammeovirga sp. SubArs3 TaxID=2995316 RepID=UPI00248BB934|nr:immunoglobulin-like domain-containing protein [Flammeovirga sp. SubArs3]